MREHLQGLRHRIHPAFVFWLTLMWVLLMGELSWGNAIAGLALGTLIVLLLPFDEIGGADSAADSPCTAVLELANIPGAVGIMEAVIVVALLSACNTQIYGSSRFLQNLAVRGDADVDPVVHGVHDGDAVASGSRGPACSRRGARGPSSTTAPCSRRCARSPCATWRASWARRSIWLRSAKPPSWTRA